LFLCAFPHRISAHASIDLVFILLTAGHDSYERTQVTRILLGCGRAELEPLSPLPHENPCAVLFLCAFPHRISAYASFKLVFISLTAGHESYERTQVTRKLLGCGRAELEPRSPLPHENTCAVLFLCAFPHRISAYASFKLVFISLTAGHESYERTQVTLILNLNKTLWKDN
jgi:hypothetical protein